MRLRQETTIDDAIAGGTYHVMARHDFCETDRSSFKTVRIRDATENKSNEELQEPMEADSDEQDTTSTQTTIKDTLETQDLPTLHTDPVLDDTPATPDEELFLLDVEWT